MALYILAELSILRAERESSSAKLCIKDDRPSARPAHRDAIRHTAGSLSQLLDFEAEQTQCDPNTSLELNIRIESTVAAGRNNLRVASSEVTEHIHHRWHVAFAQLNSCADWWLTP